MNGLITRVGQRITDGIASDGSEGFRSRAQMRLRRLILMFGDPIVSYEWCRQPMRIPLSHDLPIHRRAYPEYSENLKRVAEAVASKYESPSVVDVGANVGDSALLLHDALDGPILCVEGDPFYCSLLRANTRRFPQIEIEMSFVGSGRVSAIHQPRMKGTGRLRPTSETAGPSIKSLQEILKKRPRYESSRLLKIDTDGWDAEVLRGAVQHLRRVKPVIFFEYDPYFLALAGEHDDGFETFEMLAGLGYGAALFYLNSGDFVLGAELSHTDLLQDLHRHVLGREGGLYWDIAAFAQPDRDLFEMLRQSERRSRASQTSV